MTEKLEAVKGTRAYVLWEINEERDRQDVIWGGPSHDDEHEPSEWIHFIKEHLGKASGDFRNQMVEIAALAVAAAEAFDRSEK